MKLGTGRWIERRYRRRASLHFFRWGFHVKLRRDGLWRHFIVKAMRQSAFGRPGRRVLWVAWFRSEKGQRKPLYGFRLGFFYDSAHGLVPSRDMKIPVYPSKPRETTREFEVR